MLIESPAVIIGGFGLDNFGDDILMLASLNVVRRVFDISEITVLIYPGGEAYCRRLQPAGHFVPRSLHTKIHADVVIYGGGTQFYHFGGKPLRRSKFERAVRFMRGLRFGRMSLQNLWRREKPTIEIDKNARRAAVSLGLGPFSNPQAEQASRALLAPCEYLAVRDPISLGHCQRWELSHAVERADFGFSPELWGGQAAPSNRAAGTKRVGMVVRDWYRTPDGFSHLDATIQLAVALDGQGYEPEFFVFDAQGDTTSISRLNRRHWRLNVWSPRAMTIGEQMRRLANCELLVTARAHGAILGATLGIPSVCIEIEPKLRIMAESLGKASLVWPSPFDTQEGLRLVSMLAETLQQKRDEVFQVSQRLGQSADQSADELEQFLQSCRSHSQESR